MIGRILRIVFIVFLIGLAANRLFGCRRAVRNAVQTGAWVLLAVSALVLAGYILAN